MTPFVLNANTKSCEELLYLIGRAGWEQAETCVREKLPFVCLAFPQNPGGKFLA